MTTYDFTPTQDWFSHNIPRWEALFPLISNPNPRILEIGSWEGRSAVFLLDTLCKDGGSMVCIDHFDHLNTEAGRERLKKLTHNLDLTRKPYKIIPEFSVPGLMTLLNEATTSPDPGFDWIYVDGSHDADDTMLDGELVWRLARKGAIIIFDDYHWDKEPEDSIHHPKRGIDAFLLLHQGEYERLSPDNDYQVAIRKLTDMRIGFLISNSVEHGIASPHSALDDAFGYGINVVLTVDTAYAMGAAVVIQGILDHTSQRSTIYIVNLGLSEDDKDRLSSMVKDAGVGHTLRIIELPESSLAKQFGPVWAKLDMLAVLPVERVLYLDADVLVRGALTGIWETDLRGNAIGAARDVGHPMGHSIAASAPYFNAGVILFDLSVVRIGLEDLRSVAESMKNTRYKDQDALNAHFAENWFELSLEWNGQGLGTYARYPSSERDLLASQISKMTEDPKIIHFTGPVHPPLVEVMNPYVQPTTAKPWGYLGAPGHPYEKEWWSVLEKTPWKGYRTSIARRETDSKAREIAIVNASKAFVKRVDEIVLGAMGHLYKEHIVAIL